VASATAAGTGVRFAIDHVPVFSVGSLIGPLRRLRPDGVVMCASTQSPWERFTMPSAWTDLLGRAGFGLTLPFHADLATVAGSAVAAARPGAWYLNACFPDAVNPVLSSLGVPVLAGIGNIATIADSVMAALDIHTADRLHVLAHHAHLSAPAAPEREARVWWQGRERTDVGALLARQRSTFRPELNATTGRVTAVLLGDLLAGRTVASHLPGPGGRPGGYPVMIGPDRVDLRLPPGLDAAAAVAANLRWAADEGVTVERDTVTFTDRVTVALAPELGDVAATLRVEDLEELRKQLIRVRRRARLSPSRGATGIA
jgi:hypothetical protein